MLMAFLSNSQFNRRYCLFSYQSYLEPIRGCTQYYRSYDKTGIYFGENNFIAFSSRIFFLFYRYFLPQTPKISFATKRREVNVFRLSEWRIHVGNCFFFFLRESGAPAENRAHKTNPRFPFHVRFRVSSLPFGVLARGEVYAHKTAPQKISACSETVATQNRSG